jgi:hypothetical protein
MARDPAGMASDQSKQRSRGVRAMAGLVDLPVLLGARGT